MEVHHQEILQSIMEIDSIRANPRYKSLILMSRQTNEKREYENYCNRIRMFQNKIDKIKGSFYSNHGKTYEQFLSEKNTPLIVSTPEQPTIENVQKSEIKLEEPKLEEPKLEEPKLEEPKLEEPKLEEPKLEEPKLEEPKLEEPKLEEPKLEEPKLEEPKLEEEEIADDFS